MTVSMVPSELTGGGADVIYDPVGGDAFDESAALAGMAVCWSSVLQWAHSQYRGQYAAIKGARSRCARR